MIPIDSHQSTFFSNAVGFAFFQENYKKWQKNIHSHTFNEYIAAFFKKLQKQYLKKKIKLINAKSNFEA